MRAIPSPSLPLVICFGGLLQVDTPMELCAKKPDRFGVKLLPNGSKASLLSIIETVSIWVQIRVRQMTMKSKTKVLLRDNSGKFTLPGIVVLHERRKHTLIVSYMWDGCEREGVFNKDDVQVDCAP